MQGSRDDDERTAAEPVPFEAPPIWQALRHRPGLWAVGVLLLLALVGGTIWRVVELRREDEARLEKARNDAQPPWLRKSDPARAPAAPSPAPAPLSAVPLRLLLSHRPRVVPEQGQQQDAGSPSDPAPTWRSSHDPAIAPPMKDTAMATCSQKRPNSAAVKSPCSAGTTPATPRDVMCTRQ